MVDFDAVVPEMLTVVSDRYLYSALKSVVGLGVAEVVVVSAVMADRFLHNAPQVVRWTCLLPSHGEGYGTQNCFLDTAVVVQMCSLSYDQSLVVTFTCLVVAARLKSAPSERVPTSYIAAVVLPETWT